MKLGLTAVLAACLAGSVALAPLPVAAAQPSSDDNERAKTLYREGEKAYRVGKFAEAVEKFEAAYELSGLPIILYNIGLAYTRRYDVTSDIADLRQAKVVLQNFYIETQKDPELGDPDEVESQLKELDEKLAKAQEDERARREAERKRQEELAKQQGKDGPKGPVGADPGKKLRLGGIIAMAAGGGFLIGGGVATVVLGLRGQEFAQELKNIRNDQAAAGCGTASPDPECADLDNRESVTKNNGRKANLLQAGVGIPLLAVGAGALATGIGLFVTGNKRTKAWKKGEVVVLPAPGGLMISGRF